MDRPDEDQHPQDAATNPDEPPRSRSPHLGSRTPPPDPSSHPLVRPPIDPDAPTETVPPVDASDVTDTAGTQPTTSDETSVIPPVATLGKRARWALAAALTVVLALLVTAAAAGLQRSRQPGELAAVASASTGTSTARTSAAPAAPTPTIVVPTAPARPADALAPWAARIGTAIGVPAVAVQAYAYAQLLVQGTHPHCHLGWTTLAGIGEVQSRHGQAGGAVLDQTGRSTPPVVGPPLDGQDGRVLVADTDAGAYDGDATYDRAMGPLLLVPAAWRTHASDADNDQIQDPYDIDDASLAVARLLCEGGADMGQLAGWTSAISRVQGGDVFARDVFQTADSYGQRTKNVE